MNTSGRDCPRNATPTENGQALLPEPSSGKEQENWSRKSKLAKPSNPIVIKPTSSEVGVFLFASAFVLLTNSICAAVCRDGYTR